MSKEVKCYLCGADGSSKVESDGQTGCQYDCGGGCPSYSFDDYTFNWLEAFSTIKDRNKIADYIRRLPDKSDKYMTVTLEIIRYVLGDRKFKR
jgi:hypothetical protein